MSIRRRITIVSAAAVAVTVVLVSIGAFIAARQQVLQPIDDSLLRRAELIENIPADVRRNPGVIGGLTNAIFRPLRGDFDAVYYQIIFPDGTVLNAGEDGVALPIPDLDSVSLTEPTLRTEWVDGLHLRIVTVYQADANLFVQLARPLTEADQTLKDFAAVLALGSIVGITVAAGLGMLVSRSAVKPIERLRDDVTEVANTEELGRRLDVEGDDEVAQLAKAFNELLAKLETSRLQQVRLVRDAGHELRTPLTALRMNLEILQRHEVDPEERTSMLDAALEEVEELSDLVSEIVDLATDRYEEESIGQVELADIVERVTERVNRRNGRMIDVDCDDTTVEGRRDAIERAVANIVANADKWTPAEGTISVTVSKGTVTVLDDGPGIPERDVPHVFERFYRADTARTMSGSGLGLSIVESIVLDHGGQVFARNRIGATGAEVGFTLPF